MPNRFHLRPKYRRSADVFEITGVSPQAQRDLDRRGYPWGEETAGWRNASPHDLAKLLLVRTLRDAGIELAEAWKYAGPEIVGNIVVHALRMPGSVDVGPAADQLQKNPSLMRRWTMDFASGRKDGRGHVAGGDYFIFGPTVPANLYVDLEQALEEATRKGKAPSVLHVIPIKPLIERFAKKAGQLAFVAEVDD